MYTLKLASKLPCIPSVGKSASDDMTGRLLLMNFGAGLGSGFLSLQLWTSGLAD